MGMAVIVDGKVVYGDANELKNVQLAEVSRELERLAADTQRLVLTLDVAKETLIALLATMEGQFHSAAEAEAHVAIMEEVAHGRSDPPHAGRTRARH
jgi:DNA-binding NarL/FixJ family response regulator